MAVQAARRTSASDAEPLPDVLVSGSEAPRWRPSRRQRLGAAALLLAGATALGVPVSRSGGGPADAGPVDLALREGSTALPRRDAAPVQDRVEGGVHVEVVNRGRAPVRLLSGSVSPGAWQAAVVDDLDTAADPDGRGRLLRPGWSAVLVLHRSVSCSAGVDHGPAPTSLVLEVEVGRRLRTTALALPAGPSPDDGGLRDVLGGPERFCAPGGTGTAGTVGDPGLPFLPLWPAGTGVLPAP